MIKYLILFFFIPVKLFSQDMAGVWTGNLYNDTTKKFIKYELAISEENGRLSGYSHTIFIIDSIPNIGVKSVKIKKSMDHFLVEDDKLLYNNYKEAPAKGVKTYSDLILSENDSVLFLRGHWNTNRTKIYEQLTGTIFLQKKKELRQTLIIPKLDSLGLLETLSFFQPASPSDLSTNVPRIDNETAATKTASNAGKDVAFVPVDEMKSQKATRRNNIKKQESIKKPLPADAKNENLQSIALEKDGDSLKTDSSSVAPASGRQPQKNKIVAETKLQKKDKEKLVVPVKKVIPPAAELATRKVETIRSVEIKQDSLMLSLFDNGEIDGDTVSVLMNGKVIMPMQGLMARAINKTVYLTPDLGDSIVLIMYAENLGSIPPNTGLLVIHDGEDIFEIRFSGDLNKSSAIILRRKSNR